MKKVMLKLGLAAVAVLAAFVLAEGAVRLLLPAPPRVVVEAGRAEPAAGSGRTRQVLAAHPEEGFLYVPTAAGRRLRPNAHVVIDNHALSRRRIEIETNRLGYRNRKLAPKQGTRLLFLGDSITFGDYLPEPETFVRQVETMAVRDLRDWETINAGVGAISLKNELAILVETGLSVEPDAVVVCHYLNDFHESPGVRISRVPAALAWSRLASHLWLAAPRLVIWATGRGYGLLGASTRGLDMKAARADLEAELAARRSRMSAEQKQFYDRVLTFFPDWGGAWGKRTWSRIEPCLEEMRRLADKHGFRLFIVAFPVRDQVEAGFLADEPQQYLGELAARLDVPCLDILPRLRQAHAAGGTPLFYDHCHHTPEGNRIIAAAIYEFLARELAEQPAQDSARR
jgi:lysophospholipase L1-like esterase